VHFKGRLKLPGDRGDGVVVDLRLDDIFLEVMAGSEELGRWRMDEVTIERLVSNEFSLNLDGEPVVFIADDALGFAYEGVAAIGDVSARLTKKRRGPRRRRTAAAALAGASPAVSEEEPAASPPSAPAAAAPPSPAPAPAAPPAPPVPVAPAAPAPAGVAPAAPAPAPAPAGVAPAPPAPAPPSPAPAPPPTAAATAPAPPPPPAPAPRSPWIVPDEEEGTPVESGPPGEEVPVRAARPRHAKSDAAAASGAPARPSPGIVPDDEPAEDGEGDGRSVEPVVVDEDGAGSFAPEAAVIDFSLVDSTSGGTAAAEEPSADASAAGETSADVFVEEIPVAGVPVAGVPVAEAPVAEVFVGQAPAAEVPVGAAAAEKETPGEPAPATEVEPTRPPGPGREPPLAVVLPLRGRPDESREEAPADAPRVFGGFPAAPSETPPASTPPSAPASPARPPAAAAPPAVNPRPEPARGGRFGRRRGRAAEAAHEHVFEEGRTVGGITRRVCTECGHVSFLGEDVYEGWQ